MLGKALSAKPNPDANYFYLILDELNKVGECMTSFSKIAGKIESKTSTVMRFIRFIVIEDQSCSLSTIFLQKTTSKISFDSISVLIKFLSLV